RRAKGLEKPPRRLAAHPLRNQGDQGPADFFAVSAALTDQELRFPPRQAIKSAMEEKEEKSPIFGTAIGDLGVVVIAALCTITLLMILFSPSPFEKLERAQARQEKEKAHQAEVARQKRIDEAVATGEVSVGILPK